MKVSPSMIRPTNGQLAEDCRGLSCVQKTKEKIIIQRKIQMRNEANNSNKKRLNLVTINQISCMILQQFGRFSRFLWKFCDCLRNLSFVAEIFRILPELRQSLDKCYSLSSKMNLKVSSKIQILGRGSPASRGIDLHNASGWQRGPRLSTQESGSKPDSWSYGPRLAELLP